MKDNEQGFTLIELLLSLAISSVIILSFFSILKFTNYTCAKGEEIDQIMLNGQYALEYIKSEVRQAEKLFSIDQFEGLKEKYPNNIGFVIMRYYPEESNNKYNYLTYYLKNKRIYRIADNRDGEKLPVSSDFEGHNILVEYAESIANTKLNPEAKTLDLNFAFKGDLGEEVLFRTKLFIRCPIIY